MTEQNDVVETFVPSPPVGDIVTNNLTSEESALLLDCINKVRAGETEFYVLLTNEKVTPTKRRMPGNDYVAHPALAPHAHKGWLVAAPLNKKGDVYLHILDDARMIVDETGEHPGHTRITMQGILSFEVLKSRPGRATKPAATSVPAPANPQLVLAQAMSAQAQAMMSMAQYLTLTAAPPQPVLPAAAPAANPSLASAVAKPVEASPAS